MKIKRLLSLVLALTMIASISTFCVTSNADDLLFNSNPKAVTFTASEESATILSNTFTPDEGAEGMTLWIRISDAKEPFYLCKMAMTVQTRDFDSLSTYNHGQDGIRHAMWKIDGNGDYLLYIPFKYYSLSHQFVGEKGDYVKGISNISVAPLELNSANKNTSISLMGIFNNQVKVFDSSFDVEGTKSNHSGEYIYKNCEVVPENTMTGILAGTLTSSDEMYDPETGKTIHTGYPIDYSDAVRETWQYAYVDSALPDDPQKAANVFTGWTDSEGNAMIPYGTNELFASFEYKPSLAHTVTFHNGDGSVLSTVKVVDGKTAVYRGATPEKAGTDTTYFVFKGWSSSVMSVTEDMDVYPEFEEKDITYNVTYKMGNTPIYVNTVKKHEASVYDTEKYEIPTQNGDVEVYYEFDYWADADGARVDLSDVVSDMTVYAHFAMIPETQTYTVTFANYDGTTLCTKTTGVHSYVEYDLDNPVRKPTETVIYTFSGWDVEDYKTLREDATVTALYHESPVGVAGSKPGKVIDKTSDFSTTDEVTLVEGYTFKTDTKFLTLTLKVEGVEEPFVLGGFRMKTIARDEEGIASDSTLDSNSSGNYTNLANKSDNSSAFTFTEDGYYAITINKEIVNWEKNYYNRIVSLSFSNGTSIGKQTSNLNDNLKVTFLAMYEGKPDFTVRYYGEDGDFLGLGIVENTCANFGVTKLLSADGAYVDEVPVKAEDADYRYNFAGWADSEGNKVEYLCDNADVYAYFLPEIKDPITVTFKNGDENAAVYTIPRGKGVEYSEKAPIKPSTDDYTYIFRGWTTDPSKVLGTEVETLPETYTDDVVYYAVFEQTDRMFIVNYTGEDGSDLGTVYVNKKNHEVIGEAPADPFKEASAKYTYEFEGWVTADGEALDFAKVNDDIVVKPKFKATINKYTVTFMNEDGTAELGKVTVDYGTKAEFEEPVKENDKYHKFVFKGWSQSVTTVVRDMTVNAIFEPVFVSPFKDAVEGDWYYSAVQYVCENGLMSGTSATTFEPQTTTTRAMVVNVLYYAENAPSVEGMKHPFKDVPANEWYTKAITWAYNCGVVAGKTPDTFEPNVKITRQEFCSILYRYADKVMYDGVGCDMKIPSSDISSSTSVFADKNDIGGWAQASIKWCLYVGCISGETRTVNGVVRRYLKPTDGMTRAEMASMLKRFIGNEKLVKKS